METNDETVTAETPAMSCTLQRIDTPEDEQINELQIRKRRRRERRKARRARREARHVEAPEDPIDIPVDLPDPIIIGDTKEDEDAPTPGDRTLVVGDMSDAMWTSKTSKKEGSLETHKLRDTDILGGYRSGLINAMGTSNHTDLDWRRVAFRSKSVNGPENDWKGLGTNWATRLYGIRNAYLEDVTCSNFFGTGARDSSNEGHVLYWTVSPVEGSVYHIVRLVTNETGGHPIFFTSTYGGDGAINVDPTGRAYRIGNAPAPSALGRIIIDSCKSMNGDISAARGSFNWQFPDSHCHIDIKDSECLSDGRYVKNGRAVNSRGTLLVYGMTGDLSIKNSWFLSADECDRDMSAMIEGPPKVSIMDTRWDCEISVNHPHGDRPDTIKTKFAEVRGCSGDGDFYWLGDNYGPIAQIDARFSLEDGVKGTWTERGKKVAA